MVEVSKAFRIRLSKMNRLELMAKKLDYQGELMMAEGSSDRAKKLTAILEAIEDEFFNRRYRLRG